MYFQLQLSWDVFTRVVRNRIKSIPLCIYREFLNRKLNLLLVVDRIVVGEKTVIQREKRLNVSSGKEVVEDAASQIMWIFSPTSYTAITVPFLQVKQDVTIYLAKSADLDANGPNQTPEFQALVINPVFNVHLEVAGSGHKGEDRSFSRYTLAHIEFGAWFGLLEKDERDEITQLMANVKLPPMKVDLDQLTDLMERQVTALNAGIACDPAGTFVSLRADFDVYASPPAVDRAFFEAGPTNLLADREWAMLIDANVVTQDAARKAKDVLTTAPKVKLDSGPTASWDPGAATVNISAGVELVDACLFPVENIDLDVDVDIRAGFLVTTPNCTADAFPHRRQTVRRGRRIRLRRHRRLALAVYRTGDTKGSRS